MTRFSRFQQTLLFTTICFMSYVGLVCRVQVLLPASQLPAARDAARSPDHQQHLSAVHRSPTDDNPNESMDASEMAAVGGEDFTTPEQVQDDDVLTESESERSSRPTNGTDYDQPHSVAGASRPFDARRRAVSFVPVGGTMHVFGAYLDLRREGNATVRVFVLRRRKERDGLVLSFTADKGKNYTLYAQPYRMSENHGKEYEGWIYSYLLPASVRTPPRQVAVAPSSARRSHHAARGRTTLELKTIPPSTERRAADIGVCVPPLFGHLPLASVIHFLQMCRVLGADRVFLYTGSSASWEIRKFLTHRSQRDASFLSVRDWNLPEDVSHSSAGEGEGEGQQQEERVWYHGQLLAVHDCLYRHMASFRFLLFMDVDEMLVPRTARDWPRMLKEIFSSSSSHAGGGGGSRRSVSIDDVTTTTAATAALSFKSVFFDPTRVPQNSPGSIVYFQHLQRTVSPSRRRSKLMVRPMRVFEMGIHHLSRGLWEGEGEGRAGAGAGSVEVGEEVALLHHYRACQNSRGIIISGSSSGSIVGRHDHHEEEEGDASCELVTEDRSMLRYKEQLTRLSHHVIAEASRLFA